MKIVRIGLHSFMLVIADIAGIAGGAVAAIRITGVSNQVSLQLPIAVALSLILCFAWFFLLLILRLRRLLPAELKEIVGYLVFSMLWAPLVFVPLHYFTQGYLTSIGNLVAMAVYQLPVNTLAVAGLWVLRQKCDRRRTQ